jgi:nucleoside-diphosphate-sugar epimerase
MGRDHVIPQFIERLVTGEEFVVQGDGTQRRAYCYVDDVLAPTANALSSEGAANAIYNVGNPGEEYSVDELIRLLERVSGRTITPRYTPFEQGGTSRRLPDVARAQEKLALDPRVGLEEGLRRTYSWYAAHLE